MDHKNQDEDTRIWELLGSKRAPSVSPFFSRNVLREARKMKQKPSWGISTWIAAVGAPLAACAMLLLFVWEPLSITKSPLADNAVDFDTISNLDLFVSNEESALWSDPYSL